MAWYPQVRECCGLGEGSLLVSGPASICVWAVGMAQIQGTVPAALDPSDQAEHGQSQVVARPPRGDLGQAADQGFVPRLEDAPEDSVRGGGLPHCPWWGRPWGEHGVSPFEEPLWAGGCCCSGHYVLVPALEDCTPDLRQGVVAVCSWGREVVD